MVYLGQSAVDGEQEIRYLSFTSVCFWMKLRLESAVTMVDIYRIEIPVGIIRIFAGFLLDMRH